MKRSKFALVLTLAIMAPFSCISSPIPPVGNLTPVSGTTVEPEIPQIYLDAYVESLMPVFGVEKADAPTKHTQQQAKNLGRQHLESVEGTKMHNSDLLQAVLVRYTADPNYFEYGKLSWFLIVIPDMSLVPFLGEPPPDAFAYSTSLAYPLMEWPPVYAVFMDDTTGKYWGGSYENHRQLVSVNPKKMENLEAYASKYGWWPVWYQSLQYNGKILPDSVINGLLPPDKLVEQ